MFNPYPMMYPQYFQQPAQGMSPPTIHADIVQVSGEQEALNYPVAAGMTQMMIDRDDSAIYIKSAYANGQPTLEVYRKEEKTETPAQDYVTKEELAAMLAGMKEEKSK